MIHDLYVGTQRYILIQDLYVGTQRYILQKSRVKGATIYLKTLMMEEPREAATQSPAKNARLNIPRSVEPSSRRPVGGVKGVKGDLGDN